MEKEAHQSVLLSEVERALVPRVGEKYLDLTAGLGGHARAILAVTQNYKDAVLVDRDAMVIARLKKEFKSARIWHADFYSATLHLLECGSKFDLILADLGVSSPQLDKSERGFAFSKTGPLDMRMDQRRALTAAEIVNKWSELEIVEILERNGEIKPQMAHQIARIMIKGRPWTTTTELAAAVEQITRYYTRKHPATRVFQALRIAVNDELGQLERTLPLLPHLLNPGGRLAIITFHSLEDRLVKKFIKAQTALGEESMLEIVNKKPIVAGKTELVSNPRARSAKLRAVKKKSF